jgi:sugar/nucleoside kinase (ribokinase family)
MESWSLVTRTVSPAATYDRDGSAAYPAQQVSVVDTTGAGDAFAAGFLQQIATGGTVGQAAVAGIAWATAAVQAPASIPPPWQDVSNSLRAGPPKRRLGLSRPGGAHLRILRPQGVSHGKALG